MQAAGAFQVRVVPGGESRTLTCAAVPFGGTSFRAAVAEADLLLTAVGVENVAGLGRALALALASRPSSSPIDIWVVENADAAPVLQEAVRRAACEAALTLPPVGFAGGLAYPIVAQGDWDAESMPVFVRDHDERLVVDSSRLLGALPELPGVGVTREYGERLREKLLIFGAGHALCAYLGARCGYQRVDEAATDPLLRTLVRQFLLDARVAFELVGFLRQDLLAAVDETIHRYENEALEDSVRRVARSPIRKLAPRGALVGASKLVRRAFGATSPPFALGIASALLYRDEADRQARELAAMLDRDGIGAVLLRVCGLEPADPLFKSVVVAYERMRASRDRMAVGCRGRGSVPRHAGIRAESPRASEEALT
jgi:mannitol-1-phosphate 5-dehydrogenase